MELAVMHMSGAYLAQNFYREPLGCPDGAGQGAESRSASDGKTPGTESRGAEIGNVGIREIDCRDIEGTRSYCDDRAKERLRERIADAPFSGIHFLDSGNYHYLSLLWLEKITEPFSLVLVDHHPDMQRPAFGDITSCGGWVREALLTHPCLERVYVAGVEPELLEQEGILTGVTVSGEKADFPVERVHVGLSGLWERGGSGEEHRRPVYLSIDKDALRRQDARCDWDQGEMSMEELFGLLDQIAGHCRILGADVCGENPDDESGEVAEVNKPTNQRLAEKLLDCIVASC